MADRQFLDELDDLLRRHNATFCIREMSGGFVCHPHIFAVFSNSTTIDFGEDIYPDEAQNAWNRRAPEMKHNTSITDDSRPIVYRSRHCSFCGGEDGDPQLGGNHRDEHECLISCLARIQELKARLEVAPKRVADTMFLHNQGMQRWHGVVVRACMMKDEAGYNHEDVQGIVRKALEQEDTDG